LAEKVVIYYSITMNAQSRVTLRLILDFVGKGSIDRGYFYLFIFGTGWVANWYLSPELTGSGYLPSTHIKGQ
jgi:hypothetical protein